MYWLDENDWRFKGENGTTVAPYVGDYFGEFDPTNTFLFDKEGSVIDLVVKG
jgi:hypothetical protein